MIVLSNLIFLLDLWKISHLDLVWPLEISLPNLAEEIIVP